MGRLSAMDDGSVASTDQPDQPRGGLVPTRPRGLVLVDRRIPLLTGGPQRVMGPCACGPRPAVGRTESEKAVRLSFLLQCSTLFSATAIAPLSFIAFFFPAIHWWATPHRSVTHRVNGFTAFHISP